MSLRILLAYDYDVGPETLEGLRALGLEPVFLPGADGQPGREDRFYDLDFDHVDAVICYRFFCYNDIARFPRLKFIQTTSHGIDHMPLDYIRAHGVTLCDARGVYGVPMAEYALCGVLQLYRNMPRYREQQRAHVWQMHWDARELGGRQVTLLGAGSVGRECAKRFAAMGCRCVGLCRHPADVPEGFAELRQISELDEVLPETDVLLVTLPLTGETRGIVDARRFALLKEGAVLVNIARGPVVDEGALLAALRGGRLSGAVIDVCETEPLPADSPLWDAPNLILTPHSCFIGEHNHRRFFELALKNTAAWLKTLQEEKCNETGSH